MPTRTERPWLWLAVALCAAACAGRQDRVVGQSWDPAAAEEDAAPAREPTSSGSLPAFYFVDDGQPSDRDPRSLTEFRASLEPYGTWIDDPSYGTVWAPSGPADFAPYRTDGCWALDADGNWIWQSDYPWGSITFHYGRWLWASDQGWIWIPGYEYSPAWVVWNVGDDDAQYLGWAPAPPAFFWRHRTAVKAPPPRALWFYFIPTRYLFSRDLRRHLVRDPVRLRNIAANAHVPAQPVVVHTSRGVMLVDRHRATERMRASRVPLASAPAAPSPETAHNRVRQRPRTEMVRPPLATAPEGRAQPAPAALPSRAEQRPGRQSPSSELRSWRSRSGPAELPERAPIAPMRMPEAPSRQVPAATTPSAPLRSVPVTRPVPARAPSPPPPPPPVAHAPPSQHAPSPAARTVAPTRATGNDERRDRRR